MCWSGRWPWQSWLTLLLVIPFLASTQECSPPFPEATSNATQLAEAARAMFVQAYSNYTTHAFPMVSTPALGHDGVVGRVRPDHYQRV